MDSTQFAAKYLHTKAAAAYLGLSESTLEKGRISGYGPPFRKLGRRVLYAIGDLDTWADSCRRQSTSEVAAA
jgi:hypothetical protein